MPSSDEKGGGDISPGQELVQEIPLSELHPFEGHPFRVVDDEDMEKTVESIQEYGVLTPAIVRPDPYGGYEIIAGHRRHHASGLAGKETMPAIVRDLDDDAAIILMVDANLQRESILPSERAFAYKMKLDAIKHQGQRTDLTSSQVGIKLLLKILANLARSGQGTELRRILRIVLGKHINRLALFKRAHKFHAFRHRSVAYTLGKHVDILFKALYSVRCVLVKEVG